MPLVDNTFNRCKSNISVLEAAYCGAVPLVPEGAGWTAPGVETYTNEDDLKQKIITLTKTSFAELEAKNKALRAWVKENQLVTNPLLNGVRVRIAEALATLTKERIEKGVNYVG